MQFDARRPAPPLGEFVSLIWEWRGFTRTHAYERLMPSGEAALVVNLAEDAIRVYDAATLALERRERGAVVLGAYAAPSVIDVREQDHVFGVQFRAGGLWPFVRMPSEFTNQHVDLADAWGVDGACVRERLLECASAAARFDLAERLLRLRLCDARLGHPAVREATRRIRRSGGAGRVRPLAADLGLSERRFIQLFRQQVGLAPKTYARLERFRRVLQTAHRSTAAVDWAALALEAGYCDQSHLIHEFAEFSGMRPTDYLRQRGHHANHVVVA